jgi:hypothetical protein
MKILKYYNINSKHNDTKPKMKIGDEVFINDSETVKITKTKTGYSIFDKLYHGNFVFIDEYDTFLESYNFAKELEAIDE